MGGLGSNTGRNVKMVGGASTAMRISGLIIIIAVMIMLYYMFQWLYANTISTNTIVNLSKNVLTAEVDNSKLDTDEKKPATPKTYNKRISINGLESAGQYSVSLWVYVRDTKGFLTSGSAHLANLLEISDNRFAKNTSKRGDTLIFIGLNPVNAGLVVRQTTTNGKPAIKNSTSENLNDIIENYNNKGKYTSNDRCDIINGIEYQRWVLITVVANSRTLDVYLDGKLARSCVYSSPYGVNSMGNADVYLGANNGTRLKGYFAKTDFYNYALTPDAVWSIYQTGPSGPFNLTNWLYNFINATPPQPRTNI